MAFSLNDFSGMTFPPENWIIPELLTRQNTAFIMGPPKSATKSWLLLDAAWSLSQGDPIWGLEQTKPSRPMRTVYFTQEDTKKDAWDRIMAHEKVGGREPNDRLWVVPKDLNYALDTDDGMKGILSQLEEVCHKLNGGPAGVIDVIMLDPMRRIHHGDENDSQMIARIWREIDRLHRRYDCSVIISHHITKPPRDQSDYDPTSPYNGRGSGDIYGGGDAFMMVVPGALARDRMSRQIDVHFESKRSRQMAPASLRTDFRTGRVSYLGEAKGGRRESEGDMVDSSV